MFVGVSHYPILFLWGGLVFAVLAQCEPEAEGDLGRAEEAHVVRVLHKEAGDLAGTFRAHLPQEGVLPGGDQLDGAVTDGDDREGLFYPACPRGLHGASLPWSFGERYVEGLFVVVADDRQLDCVPRLIITQGPQQVPRALY